VTRYISYSLYGMDLKYLSGALENAQSVSSFYPNWTAIFFCGMSVPEGLKSQLVNLGSIVQNVASPEDESAMLWRYEAVYRRDAEHVIFRDTDSRLSCREADAVGEWLDSGKCMHIIRDHPNHTSAILGGAWGIDARVIKDDINLLSFQGYPKRYGLDQEVIRRKLYRNTGISRLVHDSFFVRELNSRILPSTNTWAFIGEAFTSDNLPDNEGRGLVEKYRRSLSFRLWTQAKNLKNILFDLASDLRFHFFGKH
jgi:hypothetical protein